MKPVFESILPLPASSLKAFFQEKDEFDAPWHFHPQFELTYILQSSGLRYVGNSMEHFEDDDLILLGPNLPHCWKNMEQNIHKAQAIVIQWDLDLLGKNWLDQPEFRGIKNMLALSEKGIQFSKTVAREIKDHIIAMPETAPFEKLMCFLNVLKTLSEKDSFQMLCEHNFAIKPESLQSDRINSVYQYVKQHYGEKIKLKDISSSLHMSEENFSRFFSKVMKKNFFTFLNEFRLNIACKLLIETDMQVKQISYSCGYETLPFFYRQFKRFKQVSPLQFRLTYHKMGNPELN
ncbi:AraC-type DNA-binding protein [Mucilaginibacter mallensis]|uniref:AraC-type DNA-binding protein n=1 Tax=Mucilaginibacter mallensis TaxID=652787 RepID=A0A1H1T5A2_MUCMA|nr:AraC family transcriptional regulator [Mucilaginibacter mallensis]SDS54809.1 AraC-type DNA-binding protein [Mucilaginibacter mallensis]